MSHRVFFPVLHPSSSFLATATKTGRISKRWKTTRCTCERISEYVISSDCYFHGRIYADIRRIDNGIRLLPCHSLPRNNTLPSYNSLLADQYFCPKATHDFGCLVCTIRFFSTCAYCLSIAN